MYPPHGARLNFAKYKTSKNLPPVAHSFIQYFDANNEAPVKVHIPR